MLHINRLIIPADKRVLKCKCGEVGVIKWVHTTYIFGKPVPKELESPTIPPLCLKCDRKEVDSRNDTYYPYYASRKMQHFMEYNI